MEKLVQKSCHQPVDTMQSFSILSFYTMFPALHENVTDGPSHKNDRPPPGMVQKILQSPCYMGGVMLRQDAGSLWVVNEGSLVYNLINDLGIDVEIHCQIPKNY